MTGMSPAPAAFLSAVVDHSRALVYTAIEVTLPLASAGMGSHTPFLEEQKP